MIILTKKRTENKKFHERADKLNKILDSKDLVQFIVAPVQRLTRYKLLIDVMNNEISPENERDVVRKKGLRLSKILDQILRKADEQAATYMNYQEMIKVYSLLRYDENREIVNTANFILN
jgi:hypothetical protein